MCSRGSLDILNKDWSHLDADVFNSPHTLPSYDNDGPYYVACLMNGSHHI